MNEPKKSFYAIAVVSFLILFLLVFIGAKTMARRPSANPSGTSLPGAITPSIPAAQDDVFEDVTLRAGINFVHQFCDSRIANIIESNGAGGCWIDYDGDGWPDLFLVNSGPMEGVTHHALGTVREPNHLYRNRHDGTFE